MLGRLEGRVAFITGGARGQGRATAAKFALEGADIVICDVPEQPPNVPYPIATTEDLEATADLIRGAGRRCIAEVCDVRDLAGMEALAGKAMEEFGRIDVLSANAGVWSLADCLEMSEEMFTEVIDINLIGVWKTTRAVAPHMVKRNSGSIIFTTSVGAREGTAGMIHYVAAKSGVLGLMTNFAVELGPHGIRVNAIAPGVVNSPATDNDATREMIYGRADVSEEEFLDAIRNWTLLRGETAQSPMDIADAQIWLASDESRFVTGTELTVDGGHMVLPGWNHQPVMEDKAAPRDYEETALGHVRSAAKAEQAG